MQTATGATTGLEIATSSRSQTNRGKQRNNQSGLIGIGPKWTKWYARVQVDGKNKHLGLFTDKTEAARVRDRAALEAHRNVFAVVSYPMSRFAHGLRQNIKLMPLFRA